MKKKHSNQKITVFFRNFLIIIFLLFFLLTSFAIASYQKRLAEKNADHMLLRTVADVKQDIQDVSDANMLAIVENIADDYNLLHDYALGIMDGDAGPVELFESVGVEYNKADPIESLLDYFKITYGVSEVSIIDKNGIIVESTNRNYKGFDMSSGTQASEFLCILKGEREHYIQDYQPITYDENILYKYGAHKVYDGGFVQVGYDSDKFRQDIDSTVYGITKNRHVGDEGYVMIFSDDGIIVSSPYTKILGHNISEYGVSIDRFDARAIGEPYTTTIAEKRYNCICTDVEGYYIFAIIPESETTSALSRAARFTTILELIAFASILAFVYSALRHKVVGNISSVATSLEKISKGDLDVEVDVRGTAEFDSLSDSINTTVRSLRESAEKEVQRINSELEYAKNIQRSALPTLFPPYPGRDDFEIYATMDPAKEVGGDFFDFSLLNNNELGFCVADVSGKGIPAALFMMRAKTLIKSYGLAGLGPDEILHMVNNELSSNNEADMFVTCWLGILNTDTGNIAYANAGHNPPLIRHKNGSFEYLNEFRPGFVLAGMKDITYKKHEVQLNPGDEIFLYTDGVTEATDSENQLYGEDRLKNALDAMKDESCEQMCFDLRTSIDEFVAGAPQFDDITMLSIKYFGEGNIITKEAKMENYNDLMGFIDEQLEQLGCPMAVQTKFDIAADELIANVIHYAYGDATGFLSVKVEPCQSPDGASITFLDRGIPFNPVNAPVPDTTLDAEKRQIGSLGIHIVKKLMDKVEYEYSGGNRLKITKYFN